jgi:hypothetical protein
MSIPTTCRSQPCASFHRVSAHEKAAQTSSLRRSPCHRPKWSCFACAICRGVMPRWSAHRQKLPSRWPLSRRPCCRRRWSAGLWAGRGFRRIHHRGTESQRVFCVCGGENVGVRGEMANGKVGGGRTRRRGGCAEMRREAGNMEGGRGSVFPLPRFQRGRCPSPRGRRGSSTGEPGAVLAALSKHDDERPGHGCSKQQSWQLGTRL